MSQTELTEMHRISYGAYEHETHTKLQKKFSSH